MANGPVGPALEKTVKVGANILLRTVTHYYIGTVKDIDGTGLQLEPAIWLAHQGKLNECLGQGKPQEYEVFPRGVYAFWQACVDVTRWPFSVPTK